MPSLCGAYVQGLTIRATKLSACGAPVVGVANAGVTNGFVSVQIDPQIEEGTEVTQTSASGSICYATKSKPQLKWNNVVITLCQVDPEFINLLTGMTLVMNDATPTPQAVGVQQRRTGFALANFAFETWTATQGLGCATVSAAQVPYYGYSLLPWVTDAYLTGLTWQNGGANAVINARTQDGNAWGLGSWNVINTSAGTASKLLISLPTDVQHHMQWTTLAPPTASCGAIAVV